MGIDSRCLVFLHRISRSRPLGKCATLGRQHLFIEPHLLRWASTVTGIPGSVLHRYNNCFAEDLLVKYFGAAEIVSLDLFNNDKPTVLVDLNTPIPDHLASRFDSVLDLGTSEHIFSTKEVFSNIRKLCKRSGFILHYVPGNDMCGHGMYQFSPALFQAVYSYEFAHGAARLFLNFQAMEKRIFEIKFIQEDRININFFGRMHQIVFVDNSFGSLEKPSIQQTDYVANSQVDLEAVKEKIWPMRHWLVSRLKKIAILRFCVSYMRSVRFVSSFVNRRNFKKYAITVDLTRETF